MKPASALFQIVALAACLTANLGIAGEIEMPGMRRAIQAITETGSQKNTGQAVQTRSADNH